MDYNVVLSAVYTDPALKTALDVLDKTAPHDERTVRTQVEAALLAESRAALRQLAPLESSLARLRGGVDAAQRVYAELDALVGGAAERTRAFARDAAELAARRAAEDARLALLRTYARECRVAPEDARVLAAAEAELSPEFFAALERVAQLQAEPAVLVLADAPAVGERLMLETTRLLDGAYLRVETAARRLLKQRELGAARPLLKLLAARPLLLKQVLADENAGLRAELVRRFEQFAVREQGTARVSPPRYLGAVLAFLHASVVNERENASLLLEDERGAAAALGADASSVLDELVNETISALEAPLRQHVTAIVVSQIDAPVVDEMLHVLQLYAQMLQKHLLPAVARVLEQLRAALDRQFTHCLAFVRTWEAAVDVAYAVVVQNDEGVAPSEVQTAQKVDAVLRPAFARAVADSPDSVGVLNTVDFAVMRLAGFAPAQPFLDFAQQEAAKHEQQLSAELAAELLRDAGVPEFLASRVDAPAFVARFTNFLATAGVRLQARIDQLSSPSVASRVHALAVAAFAAEYAKVDVDADLPDVETVQTLF